MPVLLFGIGVFAVVAGLVMIGFGIPINEFSFGNTLISAGTTASVGGLVIIAIGIAVGQLRRIAGMLADPANARLAMPLEDLEPIAVPRKGAGLAPAVASALTPAPVAQSASAGGRAPFPPRQKADPFDFEPEPLGAPMGAPMAAPKTGAPMDERADQSFAPSLPNPDEAPVDDDISLSPRHPQGAPAPAGMPPGALDRTSDSFDWRVPPPAAGAPSAPPRTQPANFDANPAARTQPANFDANPAARTQPANFDAMWPAEGKVESKAAKSPRRAFLPVRPQVPRPPGARNRKSRARSRSSNRASSTAWAIRSMSTVRSRPSCRRAPCVLPRSMSCAAISKRIHSEEFIAKNT